MGFISVGVGIHLILQDSSYPGLGLKTPNGKHSYQNHNTEKGNMDYN